MKPLASDARVRARPAPSSRRRATDAPSDVLAALASGDEWSGSALASSLGVTRAAVWKQIERLRSLGVTIQAVAGRGYRLDAPIELLDAARIEALIAPQQRERVGTIDVHWQIDSTSSELARVADAATAPRACLSEIQTQGRGRRGRTWQMALGGGLAMSYLRRFDGGMAALSGLSLVAGIAVVRALADAGIGGIALKWPNDIVAGGRKLGGILVELGGDALGPCHAIVGIGINVRMGARHGDAIDQPWIDLDKLTDGRALSRNDIAAKTLSRLAEALDAFAASGFAAFEDEYAEYDALRDRTVTVSGGSNTWTGVARGVTSRGALRVVREGVEVEVDSGEVSVRDAGSVEANAGSKPADPQ